MEHWQGSEGPEEAHSILGGRSPGSRGQPPAPRNSEPVLVWNETVDSSQLVPPAARSSPGRPPGLDKQLGWGQSRQRLVYTLTSRLPPSSTHTPRVARMCTGHSSWPSALFPWAPGGPAALAGRLALSMLSPNTQMGHPQHVKFMRAWPPGERMLSQDRTLVTQPELQVHSGGLGLGSPSRHG